MKSWSSLHSPTDGDSEMPLSRYYGKTRAENSSLDVDSDEVMIEIDCYPLARIGRKNSF